jgi:hypothetical protein
MKYTLSFVHFPQQYCDVHTVGQQSNRRRALPSNQQPRNNGSDQRFLCGLFRGGVFFGVRSRVIYSSGIYGTVAVGQAYDRSND